MKFSLVLLPALSVFTAAAPIERRDASIQSLITGLTAQVKTITAHLSQTLASIPADISAVEKSAVVTSVTQDITQITNAFHLTNTQIDAAAQQKTLGDLPSDVLGQLDGQPVALAKLVLPLLQEVDPALQSVLNTLELGQVYTAVQPLLSEELPALISGLSPLVEGFVTALSPLLSSVGSLLSPLLLGLDL